MPATITLPAFIECAALDVDPRAIKAVHAHGPAPYEVVAYPVADIVTDPELQKRVLDKRQLRGLLDKVKRYGLWPEMARRTRS